MQALLSSLRLHLLNHPANGGGPDRERRLAYVSELLAAFAASVSGAPAASGDEEARSADSPLVEPLSPRELDVLRLVAAGLTNQAIADRLFIAVSTVKSHTHSIYGKLGVRNRTQAIAQARTLGLL
jgi:LuxR family maltose regulon positive regulatory protein